MKKIYLITSGLFKKKINKDNFLYLYPWLKENVYSDSSLSNKKWKKDLSYCAKIIRKIKPILYKSMNEIHNLKYPQYFWDICMGIWVENFITIAFERWNRINNFKKKFTHVEVPNYNLSNLAENTLEDFQEKIQTDHWNSIFFGRIFEFKNNCTIKKISIKPTKLLRQKIAKRQYFYEKYVFINSYLDKINELKINLKLGQFPNFRRDYLIPERFKYNKNLRINKILIKNKNLFESFLLQNIFFYIPKAYLEGFKKLDDVIIDEQLPNKPKGIYCGIFPRKSHILKYLANQRFNGVKLICSAHGGGSQTINPGREFEKRNSSFFLTWDNVGLTKNEFNIGYLKKKYTNKKPKNVVIFLYNHAKYINKPHIEEIFIHRNYIENIINMIEKFNEKVKNKLLVRLIGEDFWGQISIYKKRFPKLLFDSGQIRISNIYNNAKLIISTYNSTTIVEGIYNNIPSCLIINKGDIEKTVIKKKRKYYMLLKEVGILHTNIEKFTDFINNLENDDDKIHKWWNSNKTQKAIKIFKEKICPQNKNITNDLVNYLK